MKGTHSIMSIILVFANKEFLEQGLIAHDATILWMVA
jgi:hypothetical protein